MPSASRVTPDQAAEIGVRRFGVRGTAQRLASEIDDTFRLILPDGTSRLLKISALGAEPAHPGVGAGPAGGNGHQGRHGRAGHNPAEHGTAVAGQDEASFQTAVLLQLASAAPGLPVQRVIPALDGRPEAILGVPGPAGSPGLPRLARMTTWLDGRLLGTADTSGALRRDIGATLARLSIALREFRHPAAHRTHRWDLQNFGALRALLDEMPDAALRLAASQAQVNGQRDHADGQHAQAWQQARAGQQAAGSLRAALTECLDRFDAVVKPRLATLPAQVIHTDFHGENLLTDGARVTGILDFGDALPGPVAMDVGIAACYQLGTGTGTGTGTGRGTDAGTSTGAGRSTDAGTSTGRGTAAADPLEPALDVVAGYHAVDPLQPADLPLIGEFILLRLATRIIVSQWNAARDPANAGYLLRRTPQALQQFGLLRAAGPDAIHDRLRTALENAR